MRCHANSCTEPNTLSEEDAVDDGGVPAHPQCATYADKPCPGDPTDYADSRCVNCGALQAHHPRRLAANSPTLGQPGLLT